MRRMDGTNTDDYNHDDCGQCCTVLVQSLAGRAQGIPQFKLFVFVERC
jgi:hypothetical protein